MFPFVVPSPVAEGIQPAELGWGSHELALPADGRRHTFGKKYGMGGGGGGTASLMPPMTRHIAAVIQASFINTRTPP